MDYLRSTTLETLIQQFIPGAEYGVFYVRHPEEATGRITSRMSRTSSPLICSGVCAMSNSAGVTSFTRTSVVCADNTTATSNV